jgi:heme/copper-type cytochrome/quinol oxidase subunit 2
METGQGLARVVAALGDTVIDVAPIVIVLVGFQALVLRQKLPHMRRTMIGIVYVVLGLALFLVGLEQALFPLGKTMAQQLSSFSFVHGHADDGVSAVTWHDYLWLYAFAAAIGFSTTLAEPSLMAVALKAREVSGGAINPWGLRLAVAAGAAIGVALGSFRIVTGASLPLIIMAVYGVVIVQAVLAPRFIVPLAFDSGGVTTSTVTVPLVAALGLGLASTIPDRSPLIDGFGLIAFTCLFPIITVLGYAQFSAWRHRRRTERSTDGNGPEED